MNYRGDIQLGDTIDIKFTTVSTTGVPTTLAGSPVISAYVGNGTTELTAGITLTVDFDSRTGMHNVRVVASSGNGYAAATNVDLVITTGTVGGASVVGYVVGSFSIEARPVNLTKWLGTAAATPATAGIPDVNAKNLNNQAVSASGTVTFPNATLASTTNITAGTVTTATNVTTVNGLAASVITAASIAAAALNGKGDWNIGKTGYALSSAAIQAIWDALTSALTTVGSIGKRISDFLTGDAYVRLGAPAGASVSADIAAIEAQTDDIGAAGAGLTALGDARLANLDATVNSRATPAQVATELATYDAPTFAELDARTDAIDAALVVIDDFLDLEVAAIKAKTDNLPADPADASDIATAFTGVNTKLDTIDDFLDLEVAAIKAKTDALPADPADASDIAALFVTVNTKLDAIDDFVDGEVAAIKAVTDKVDTALELDGAVYRLTANALEQAPTGGGASQASVDAIAFTIGAAGAGLTALATQLSVNTIDDFVDTEIAALVAAANAIKAKTDQLAFTVANKVDANTKSINDVTITGNGQLGTEFGV